MKYENNNEYTFITANGNEFMIWFENDKPVKIYTYKDSGVKGLSLASWRSKNNALFIHCPVTRLNEVWEFLNFNSICIEH